MFIWGTPILSKCEGRNFNEISHPHESVIFWIFCPSLLQPPRKILKSGHRTGLEVRAPRNLPTDGSNLLAPLRLRPHHSDSASSERDQISPPHLRVWYGVCFGSLWPVFSLRGGSHAGLEKNTFPCFWVDGPSDRFNQKLVKNGLERWLYISVHCDSFLCSHYADCALMSNSGVFSLCWRRHDTAASLVSKCGSMTNSLLRRASA